MVCVKHQVHEILFSLVLFKEISEPLLVETLCCIRNLIANCDENKRLLLKSKVKETSVMDGLVGLLKKKKAVFSPVVEIFRILAAVPDHRNIIFKVSLEKLTMC